LYFAKQVVTNACATVALVNILMNSDQVRSMRPAVAHASLVFNWLHVVGLTRYDRTIPFITLIEVREQLVLTF
jgi:hypothetical protein